MTNSFAADFLNDYEAMQSDRARYDEMIEAQYRSAEINFGLDASRAIDNSSWYADDNNRLPSPKPCQCALCSDPRELQEAA
jgi:hypothetical protein